MKKQAPAAEPTEPTAAGVEPPPAAPVAPNVDSTPSTVQVNDVAAALILEQPAVQPHAIAQAQADAVSQAGKDVNGDIFNAGVHAANADGSPRLTTGGAFAKKRGRKAGNASTVPADGSKVVIPGAASTGAPKLTKEQLARRGGTGAANLLLMVGVGLGGDEWQPRKDDKIGLDEKAMLESAFGDYFVANEYADLPPGWALTAAIGMYALPRFGMPKTQTRLQRVKSWIGAKYVQWKARRAGLKVHVSSASEAELVNDELAHRASMPAAK